MKKLKIPNDRLESIPLSYLKQVAFLVKRLS